MSKYPRWQKNTINKALRTRRVVILSGARQTGKTTLAKSLITPQTEYRTLDDKTLLQAAINDPREFVKHHTQFMIIDEVQKAVDLLPAIKKAVDENNQPGQYLLTGSANLQSLPNVTESLAGRVRKVPLRPLAQGEIYANAPNFIEYAFEESFQHTGTIANRDEIIKIAMRGGYPEVITLSSKERSIWHQDYIAALLERDMKDVINIRRHDAMKNLLHVVLAWSTKLMDISAIGSGLAIKRLTLESYLNALEVLYLIERIPPWIKTDYERVGKQSKLIANDSGLMTSLLKWRFSDIHLDTDRVGKLIETHVGNELQKQIDVSEGEYTLYHYRDREKREIDFIIERDNGDLLGIEVKASTMVNNADFKHLKWFKSTMSDSKSFIGIVLYAGEHAVSFANNLWAVPIGYLYGSSK